MDYRLIIVIVFTGVIHLVNTLGYSVRLAGVQTKSLAIANSMWNVIFLVSSTANTIQAPFLGKIVDAASSNITSSPAGKAIITAQLNNDIRIIIIAATLGSILGIFILPSFVYLFKKGIERFNQVGSVPRIILSVFLPANAWKILRSINFKENKKFYKDLKRIVPTKVLILNVLIWGLFTTAILSSMYAGVLMPSLSRTTITLASIVNGLATILLFTMVDPYISAITDQGLRAERTEAEVKSVVVYMAISRAVGTVLAQVFFVPAAIVIMYVAKTL